MLPDRARGVLRLLVPGNGADRLHGGAVLQAEILHHAGYDTWNWSDKALYRAARFLYATANWPAVGDDRWQPWLIDARTGANFPRPSTTQPGKNFGFTDWLYGG